MKFRNFLTELRRRNVSKVAAAYAVIAWLLIQAGSILFPTFDAPPWVMKAFVTIIAAGFPIALVIAWAFEMTPEGMKRTENVPPDEFIPQWSRRNFAIFVISIAVLACGLFAYQFRQPKKMRAPREENLATDSLPKKSIAVLPFESLSEDKNNAYFAEGIQDQILTRLSKIADLKVISRTSTEKYKSAPDNLRQIAQQLGVANILEGSVQKASDQVRVTVQLINARNDDHLWAETYDRTMSNIFGVETEVAEKVASSLEAKLTGREKKEIAFEGTKNPAAYDALLHGIALRNGQSRAEHEKMRAYFQRAVELDPNYAQAWAMLGAAELDVYPTAEQKERARKDIETAIRLAPDMEDGHLGMGIYKYYALQDYEGALAEFKIAREQEPNDWAVIYFTALVERRQGKLDEAIRGFKETAIYDPLNEDILVNLANSYRGTRKLEEARMIFDRALTIAPQETNIIAKKAECYAAEGDVDTAWQLINKLAFSPEDSGFGDAMQILLMRRQFGEMLRRAQVVLAHEKEHPPVVAQITRAATAVIYLLQNDGAAAAPYIAEARRDREQWRKDTNTLPALYRFDILMEARLGDRAEVEREIKELFSQTKNDNWEFPNSEVTAAMGYVQLHDLDQALPLLAEALTRSSESSITTSYLKLDPVWDSARGDPRFQKLCAPSQQ